MKPHKISYHLAKKPVPFNDIKPGSLFSPSPAGYPLIFKSAYVDRAGVWECFVVGEGDKYTPEKRIDLMEFYPVYSFPYWEDLYTPLLEVVTLLITQHKLSKEDEIIKKLNQVILYLRNTIYK